jgi:protein subunit release factor B
VVEEMSGEVAGIKVVFSH